LKKFYDDEAQFGHVTTMKLFDDATNLRGMLLAVGFSTGHVLVYDFEYLMQKN
jgi:hypothetical protein